MVFGIQKYTDPYMEKTEKYIQEHTVKKMGLPDGSDVDYWTLTSDENELLNQLLYNAYGGNPQLKRLFMYHRENIAKYLGYIMYQRKSPFTGTRTSSGGIAGCVLHPQHFASVASAATNINMGGWKCGLAARTGKGYTGRSQAAADTTLMSSVTIPNDLWVVVLGLSTDLNHATTAYSVGGTQQVVTGVRWTVDGVATQPIAIYSTSAVSNTCDTPITPLPLIPMAEKSVVTEEFYVEGTITANTTAFNIRDIGLTFGVGSVLTAL